MMVTLKKMGVSPEVLMDVTPFLDEEARQIVVQELERTAFQRTLPDIRLRLSNADGDFSTLFSGYKATSEFEVCVYDDDAARRFWGFVDNESVLFTLVGEWAEFDAYSTLKRFWEKAKTTKIFNLNGVLGFIDRGETVTLQSWLGSQIAFSRLHDEWKLFRALDCGAYANEYIRGYGNSVTWGNYGRAQDLNPETTFDELLKAIALYYNAEFYIDPSSQSLKMVQRGTILNDRQVNLDDVLCDDEEIEVLGLDEATAEYIYTMATVEVDAPTYNDVRDSGEAAGAYKGLHAGTHYWLVTYVMNGVEVFRSQQLSKTLDPVPHGWTAYEVLLDIPAGPAGTERRILYRKDAYDTTGTFRIVGNIPNGNSPTQVWDAVGIGLLYSNGILPQIDGSAGAWYHFDESDGTWDDPIVDIPAGENTPPGKILDVSPKIQFTEPGRKDLLRAFSRRDVYAFFLKSFNIGEELTRLRWQDVFRTRRLIRAKVEGVDWEIGDSLVSEKGSFPNDFTVDKRMVVKKATVDLNDETAILEARTV